MNAPTTFPRSTDACDRVLAAVRDWFRTWGRSPGYADIERAALVHKGRISRYLDRLQREGFLTRQPGTDRSIELVDRLANFSDDELIAACVGRNLIAPRHPHQIALVLGHAFPADTRSGTDCPLSDLIEKLDTISISGGSADGAQELDEDQDDGTGEARRKAG